MSVVYGTLADFGLSLLTPYLPQIVFTPSTPATATGGGGVALLLASRPIVCLPANDGTFEQELYPNEGTSPETFYTVKIVWVNGDGIPVGTDFIDGHLIVPNEGGPINGGMLRQGLSPLGVWITSTDDIPPEGEPGDFQWNTTTQDIFRLS